MDHELNVGPSSHAGMVLCTFELSVSTINGSDCSVLCVISIVQSSRQFWPLIRQMVWMYIAPSTAAPFPDVSHLNWMPQLYSSIEHNCCMHALHHNLFIFVVEINATQTTHHPNPQPKPTIQPTKRLPIKMLLFFFFGQTEIQDVAIRSTSFFPKWMTFVVDHAWMPEESRSSHVSYMWCKIGFVTVLLILKI